MALTQEKMAQIQAQLQGLGPEEQQAKMQEIMSQLSPEEMQDLQQQQCPFCAIGAGGIPASVVYDDETVMAVLDINPANKGHVIVFPKQHAQFLFQLEDKIVSHMFTVANKLSVAVFEAVNAQGTNIFVANGQVAGQNAAHVIVHVIPRFENDGLNLVWQPKQVPEEEMNAIADKIKAKNISVGKEEAVVEEKEIEKHDFDEQERVP